LFFNVHNSPTVVDTKVTGEVKKNVEEHVVQFRDIAKEQLELQDVQEAIRESKEHADGLCMGRAEQDDTETRRRNITLWHVCAAVVRPMQNE